MQGIIRCIQSLLYVWMLVLSGKKTIQTTKIWRSVTETKKNGNKRVEYVGKRACRWVAAGKPFPNCLER
jgi:hypothetical protein